MEVLTIVSSKTFSAGKKTYLITTETHRGKFILPFVTQSHPALTNLKNIQTL